MSLFRFFFFSDKNSRETKGKNVISSKARINVCGFAWFGSYSMYCNKTYTGLQTATLSIDQSNHSTGYVNFQLTRIDHLTLKVTTAQIVQTSVANNSPSQDSSHPDDHSQSWYVTPGFLKIYLN